MSQHKILDSHRGHLVIFVIVVLRHLVLCMPAELMRRSFITITSPITSFMTHDHPDKQRLVSDRESHEDTMDDSRSRTG
jgi:hypothetical protein